MLRSENEPTQKKQAESMIVCILQSTGVIDIASEDLMAIDLENLFEIIRKHTITISCFKLNLATLDADGFMHKFLKCLASQPSLKSLDLSSCRISDGNMQFLLYRLSDLNLTDLNLNETYFNCLESLRDSLSQKNTLISLKLRGNFISYPGMAEALSKQSLLSFLDLSSTRISDDFLIEMFGFFKEHRTPVRHLKIHHNCYGDQAIKPVVQYLEFNPLLETLYLDVGNLTPKMFLHLSESIKNHPGLKHLGLYGHFDDAHLLYVENILKNLNLESLVLNKKNISAQGAACLIKAIPSNGRLRSFDFDYTCIGKIGLEKFLEALSNNKTLRHIGCMRMSDFIDEFMSVFERSSLVSFTMSFERLKDSTIKKIADTIVSIKDRVLEMDLSSLLRNRVVKEEMKSILIQSVEQQKLVGLGSKVVLPSEQKRKASIEEVSDKKTNLPLGVKNGYR